MVSKFVELSSQQQNCQQSFPSAKMLPAQPAVNATNAKYKGFAIRPSNTFFTDGEFDPWRVVSLLSTESFAPKVTVTQNIPQCNVAPPQSEVFGYVLKNCVHGQDFSGGIQADKAIGMFIK